MKDLPLLIRNLWTNSEILARFIEAIPQDRLFVQRRPGLWTIAEHVQHLADTQSMLLGRIRAFEKESEPNFIPFIPKDDEVRTEAKTIDIEDALQCFTRFRGDQVELLNQIDASVWDKAASHPEYEQYSLYILVRHILMHDHWHMYRMEELWLTRDEYLTEL